jgi:hemerythrin-like metal-binding protein
MANLKKEIKWIDALSVGEKTIDSQHQKLIAELNDLIKKANEKPSSEQLKEIRDIIHFLDSYGKEHFSYEEKYMARNNYSGLKKHAKIHKAFIKFYAKFEDKFEKMYKSNDKFLAEKLKKLSNDARRFLADWFVNHISKDDHKYAVFINLKNKKIGSKKINFSEIASEIKEQINGQGKHLDKIRNEELKSKTKDKKGKKEFVKTEVPGFDELFENGIPQSNNVLVAGGAGSGKTIFCLQTLVNKANEGKKCIYMTLEEREERLIEHMEGFGWNVKELIKKGKLKILRINPFDITRNVDALLAKQKGELLIDIDPVILPKDFKPDFIVIDSLTAIASAFTNKDESYRIYIEQLFRFLEKTKATSFLITETEQVPKIYSTTGVEEFLADGVIVMYNIKRGDVRENALEVLKMRGEKHQKKIVAMQITGNGVVVYPEQEVFSEVNTD